MNERLPTPNFDADKVASGGSTTDPKPTTRHQPMSPDAAVIPDENEDDERPEPTAEDVAKTNKAVEDNLALIAAGASESTKGLSNALKHFLNDQQPKESDAIQAVPFFLHMDGITPEMVEEVLRQKGFDPTVVKNIMAQAKDTKLPGDLKLQSNPEKQKEARAYEEQAKAVVEDPEFQQLIVQGKDAPEEVKKSVKKKMGELDINMGNLLITVGYTVGITFILYLMFLRIAANAMGGGKSR